MLIPIRSTNAYTYTYTYTYTHTLTYIHINFEKIMDENIYLKKIYSFQILKIFNKIHYSIIMCAD